MGLGMMVGCITTNQLSVDYMRMSIPYSIVECTPLNSRIILRWNAT